MTANFGTVLNCDLSTCLRAQLVLSLSSFFFAVALSLYVTSAIIYFISAQTSSGFLLSSLYSTSPSLVSCNLQLHHADLNTLFQVTCPDSNALFQVTCLDSNTSFQVTCSHSNTCFKSPVLIQTPRFKSPVKLYLMQSASVTAISCWSIVPVVPDTCVYLYDKTWLVLCTLTSDCARLCFHISTMHLNSKADVVFKLCLAEISVF
jgi:hypothetical protein